MLFSCFFILVSSVSAADYYVNNDTQDVSTWMKSDAKNGDSLIFNVTQYELKDTLVVNKAVTIKSDINTKLIFNKNGKDMFNLTTNNIKFSGLDIQFNAKGSSKYKPTAIAFVEKKAVVFDMDNVNITVSQSYAGAIGGEKAKGNIVNCNIILLKDNAVGFSVGTWTGNIINSTITAKGSNSYGMAFKTLKGNLINVNVQSSGKNSIAVYAYTWNGKIENSSIINTGKTLYDTGFVSVKSKGQIVGSTIKSSKSYSTMVSDNVKFVGSSLSSGKKFKKTYWYRAELVISNQYAVKKNTYTFIVANNGYFKSKKCHVGVSVKGKLVGKKAVKALNPGKYAIVKVKIPAKHASAKVAKVAKVDYYNKVKEFFKKDNVFKFKG